MQAIKQNRCEKWYEMRKTMQGTENEANEQKKMQDAENKANERKTMQDAENEVKARCKAKTSVRQHA